MLKTLTSSELFSEKLDKLEEVTDGRPCALVKRENVEWMTHFPGLAFHADFESEEYVLIVHDMDVRAVREWPVPEPVEITTLKESGDLTPVRVVDDESAFRRVPCWRAENVSDSVTRARLSKSEREIKVIRELVGITEEIFDDVLPPTGLSEAETASELIKRAWALNLRTAFDPIVAYDEGSGIPHHRSSSDAREWNKCALVDYGVKLVYCTDVTRTMVSSEDAAEILEIVVEALKEALRELCADENPEKLEKELREWMENEAPGFEFPHSLGHHVGVTVHEGRLRGVLPENAVITVEPGLYSEKFGVRVEEMVVVGKSGCRRLTSLPRVLHD